MLVVGISREGKSLECAEAASACSLSEQAVCPASVCKQIGVVPWKTLTGRARETLTHPSTFTGVDSVVCALNK